MGKEQPASYYDAAYKKSTEYSKPWQESRYRKVWERMIERFDNEKRIIDLGCGVGQTAALMLEKGFGRYVGIDFSLFAVQTARVYFDKSPKYQFICEDLFRYVAGWDCDFHGKAEDQQIFCSETLEHIKGDVELLAMIQAKFPGSRIALSVPTFDDPGHVRHFKSPTEVRIRYCPYIDVDDLSQIGPWIILQGRLKK